MQEQHYSDFVNKVSDAIAAESPEVGGVKGRIMAEFDAIRDRGELLTLKPEEVALLEGYRLWLASPKSASGVFHWKRSR